MNREKYVMVQELIKRHNLGGAIFFRPDELVMILGYRPHWGLSVCLCFEENDPILYIPEIEPKDYIDSDINVKTFSYGMENSNPFDKLYEMISNDIKIFGNSNKPLTFIKNIGGTSPPILSAEAPPIPSNFIDKLLKISCGGYKFLDEEIIQLYNYKTKKDIESLRLCNKIAGLGIATFYRLAKEGVSEAFISAEMESVVRKSIELEGVNYASGFAQVQSGINGSNGDKYNWVTSKKLLDGEVVMTEFAVVVNGYWTDITRTAMVGEKNEIYIKLHKAVKKAQQCALELVKEGVVAEKLYYAAYNSLKEDGLESYFTHPLGHSVGFRYHDPCLKIAPMVTEKLKSNMVITIEPGIYSKDFGGIRIEDNILVTKNGYEILSDFSRELVGD